MKIASVLEQTLRIAVPYLFAASGGVIAERSGVVSLTLEGFMLTGAFTAALGGALTGSAWVAILTGALGGLVFGLIHAFGSLRFRADQIVMGIAINLLAVGATRLFLKLVFKSSSNSGRVPGFGSEGAGSLATFENPVLWVGLIAIPLVAWIVDRTPYGLRVRAAGEHPAAAASLGIDVASVRAVAVAVSGALAGLGGAYLALDQHQFTDGMTAGRGFIALAAIIVGSWRPWRAAAACLLFAGAETLQIQLQSLQVVPSQFLSMLPYALTIIVLLGRFGRARPPAALGRVE
jgi:general nucleoside transport system permease protein